MDWLLGGRAADPVEPRKGPARAEPRVAASARSQETRTTGERCRSGNGNDCQRRRGAVGKRLEGAISTDSPQALLFGGPQCGWHGKRRVAAKRRAIANNR